MNTILSTYHRHLTDIYDTIDTREDPTAKIQAMQSSLKQQVQKYMSTINHTQSLFKKWNSKRYPVPMFEQHKGMSDEEFLDGIIEHRIQSVLRFDVEFVRKPLSINDFIHLRNDTTDMYPGVYDNERLAIYTLYTAGVCEANDITVTTFNDPTTSGFVELANRRMAQLKNAKSREEYDQLIEKYKI